MLNTCWCKGCNGQKVLTRQLLRLHYRKYGVSVSAPPPPPPPPWQKVLLAYQFQITFLLQLASTLLSDRFISNNNVTNMGIDQIHPLSVNQTVSTRDNSGNKRGDATTRPDALSYSRDKSGITLKLPPRPQMSRPPNRRIS